MIGLMVAALMQAAVPQTCADALCDADRLRPFFDALAGTRATRHPVRIVQIGDSHTAGDQITGTWRALLQARYGFAGRGILPPGRPYAGYLTRGITASQSDGWVVSGIFGPSYRVTGSPPIGLGGYSLTSARPGAAMALSADAAGQMFDRFTVCALRRPGAGAVRLTLGAMTEDWRLDAPRDEAACRTLTSPTPVASAGLSVAAGEATIVSWSTERAGGGGVILSNLGTVGAQFVHFDRTDEAVIATELRTYAPDLIVLAFGTNEAFRPGFSAAAYDGALQADLARVRRLVPGVPILLLGAPDSATRTPSLMAGEAGASGACADATSPWRPTAALAVVQDIQRRQAHDGGAAYWNWSMRMGGRCSATGWAGAAPPLMRGDHVHFTSIGGAEIARLLQADLDAASADRDADPSAIPTFVFHSRSR